MPKPTDEQVRAAVAVKCPVCDAEPGLRCRQANSLRGVAPHARRIQAGQEAAAHDPHAELEQKHG
jgi:hypothetical protein